MWSLSSLRGLHKAKILNLPRAINVNPSRSRSTAVIGDKALDENGLPKSGTEQRHLTFDDSQIAYKCKSTLELLRAYMVFTLCSVSFLVDHQYKILKWTRRLIGRPLFRRLMAATVYGQFMAGEEAHTILAYIEKHKKYNVQSMLNYTALETHGFTIDSKTDFNEEELWKANITEINNCVDLAARSLEQDLRSQKNFDYATIALKVTGLTSEETLTNMNSVIDANTKLVEDAFKRKEESGILMQCLNDIAISSTSLAQELGLPSHTNTNNSTKWMSLLTNQAFHLAAMQSEDLVKLSKERGHNLTQPMSHKELNQVLTLFHWMSESAQKAEGSGVRIAVDAEQSYLQLALDVLTLDLMRRFNTERPVIFNTYQCYRTRTHDIVVRDLQIAQDEDFTHGSKVVRGGYMDEERKLAAEHGYPDPINPNYEATTAMYYKVAEELLQRVQSDSSGKKVQILFATHNEDTVKHIANRMHERGMTPDGNTVLFGQLMGMRDHISFSLGHAGLPAAKMLHYGPIDQGMAYLSRRVTENRGGIETADKEREMVKREIFRRVKTRELRHKSA